MHNLGHEALLLRDLVDAALHDRRNESSELEFHHFRLIIPLGIFSVEKQVVAQILRKLLKMALLGSTSKHRQIPKQERNSYENLIQLHVLASVHYF